jgi:3-isopropylmalate dehydrogenase
MGVVCPIAAIGAAQMMLETLGDKESAARIEKGIMDALSSGKIKSLSAGKMGMSTSECGDLIAELASR